jgi:hypothetical protein
MNNHFPCRLARVALAVPLILATVAARADNLLVDGCFARQEEGVSVNWSIRDNKQEVAVDASEAHHPQVEQALRVDILCDGGSSYGQIAQAVSVKPNTVYRFAGDWRSSKGQTGFFQIKRIKDREFVKHFPSGSRSTAHGTCRRAGISPLPTARRPATGTLTARIIGMRMDSARSVTFETSSTSVAGLLTTPMAAGSL